MSPDVVVVALFPARWLLHGPAAHHEKVSSWTAEYINDDKQGCACSSMVLVDVNVHVQMNIVAKQRAIDLDSLVFAGIATGRRGGRDVFS